jgi:hypothetical protein
MTDAPPRTSPPGHPPAPPVGTLARDTRRDRVGVVMDVIASRLWLRAQGGGREWEAGRADVVQLAAADGPPPPAPEPGRG